MQEIKVELDNSYPIYIESGSLSSLGRLYKGHKLGNRVAIITDRNVADLYGSKVRNTLKSADIDCETIVLPPGEENKTLTWVNNLYDKLLAHHYDRGAAILALGGGVVGDIAGFAAATFLRGIDWVQVPTTLLSQVDASIGGKTGVNHPQGKNLIGAFHQPHFVLIDPETLTTLEGREFSAGLGEVVKYALIKDKEMFEVLEKEIKDVTKDNKKILEELITTCCQIKAWVVAQDERERDLRRILNFGHTIGHALEAVTDYHKFLHGEALIWGMLAASHLSCKSGLLLEATHQRIVNLLTQLERPSLPDVEDIIRRIYSDKKVRDGKINFVLLEDIGTTSITDGIGDAEIKEAIAYIMEEL